MEGKWEGKLSIEIPSITADQAWDCLKDFCNIHKWLTTLDTCYQVEEEEEEEGVAAEPGLVRYCATSTLDANGGKIVLWVNEKLLTINPVERVISYEVTENNMGLKSYNATMKVEQGCRIDWSFISDPIPGQNLEEFTAFVDGSLKCIAKNMHDTFSAPAV